MPGIKFHRPTREFPRQRLWQKWQGPVSSVRMAALLSTGGGSPSQTVAFAFVGSVAAATNSASSATAFATAD